VFVLRINTYSEINEVVKPSRVSVEGDRYTNLEGVLRWMIFCGSS